MSLHNQIQEKSAKCATKAVFAGHRQMRLYSAPMRIQTNRRVFLKGLGVGVVAGPSLAARPTVIEEIDSYFSPPEEWRGKFGEFRSPLIFNDEKSYYFPRLVLKGRAIPVPSGGILAGGYGATWESKF